MLKLNYIITSNVPLVELIMLKSNIRKSSGIQLLDVTSPDEQENWNRIQEFPAEQSIFLSTDRGLIKKVQEYGMAVIELDVKDCQCTDDVEVRADMLVQGLEEVDDNFLVRVFQRKHHIPWTILETDRLLVRELTLEDVDDLFELYAEPGMTDYMEPLYSYEKEVEYQKAYIEHMYRFFGYGMWLVFEKETGRLVGRAGLENREELDGEMELGYAIGTSYQRKGYATEVCRAIIRYAIDYLEIEKLNCLIETGNIVSEHVAQKVGFTFQGELDIDGTNMKRYEYGKNIETA